LVGFSVFRNQLTSLILPNTTTLTWVNAIANQLLTLDVSVATALESLFVNTNRLTSLDVTNNIALTALDVRWNSMTSDNVVLGWQTTTIPLVSGTTFLYATQRTATITITTQPNAVTIVTEGNISGDLTVAATVVPPTATLFYEWFSNTVPNNRTGTPTGITSTTFTIPTTLSAGTYYYYAAISVEDPYNANQLLTNVATVTVSVP
jgi:hypothetical protein